MFAAKAQHTRINAMAVMSHFYRVLQGMLSLLSTLSNRIESTALCIFFFASVLTVLHGTDGQFMLYKKYCLSRHRRFRYGKNVYKINYQKLECYSLRVHFEDAYTQSVCILKTHIPRRKTTNNECEALWFSKTVKGFVFKNLLENFLSLFF